MSSKNIIKEELFMKKILFFLLIICFTSFADTQTVISDSGDEYLTTQLKGFGVNDKSINLYKKARLLNYESKEYAKGLLSAIKADPKNYFALDDLGAYYRRIENNADKAIEYYKKSIAVNPANPFPYYHMGIAYFYKNDYINAEKTFLILIEKIPDHPEGYYGLADLYIKEKDFEKGLDAAEKEKIFYINLNLEKYPEEAITRDAYLIDCEYLIALANYNLGNYSKTVDSFFYSLQEIKKYNTGMYESFAELAYVANENLKDTNPALYNKNFEKFKKSGVVSE